MISVRLFDKDDPRGGACGTMFLDVDNDSNAEAWLDKACQDIMDDGADLNFDTIVAYLRRSIDVEVGMPEVDYYI